MRVNVVPYDPEWPAAFESVRRRLASALRGVDVRSIEHVGSTSVPGLAAKPIIDVDVIVLAASLGAAVRALEAAGYTHKGELGVPDRHAVDAPDDAPRRNVYLAIDGCLALRNHLGVRDVLRADPKLRDRYGEVKLSLAQRDYEHIDQYIADKSAVLRDVLEQAGLTPDEIASIDGVNQDDRNGSRIPETDANEW